MNKEMSFIYLFFSNGCSLWFQPAIQQRGRKVEMTVKKLCLSLTTFCAAVQINWIYYAFANLIT